MPLGVRKGGNAVEGGNAGPLPVLDVPGDVYDCLNILVHTQGMTQSIRKVYKEHSTPVGGGGILKSR